ncbi:MAG: hypothetical protein KA981_02705 [Bacteroidia bacterium]|nr:hypothetical protein [Bacteroidia bacterium]
MKIRIPQFAFVLSILFVFFGSNRTFASHVTGSDFTYKCTSTPGLYEITARVYRDCAGVPLCSNCPTSLSPSCTIQLTVGGVVQMEVVRQMKVAQQMKVVRQMKAQLVQILPQESPK